ncbi:MAG: hypothetical protein QME05_03400 [Candidatus Margulisbacteria bacterium]|nr:hypothetical protein [Candidatus Margulisiibacteriota bacterium]
MAGEVKKKMIDLKEKFVVDEKGSKLGVLMDTREFEKLLNYIEYMEDSLELKTALKNEKEKGLTLASYLKKLKRK